MWFESIHLMHGSRGRECVRLMYGSKARGCFEVGVVEECIYSKAIMYVFQRTPLMKKTPLFIEFLSRFCGLGFGWSMDPTNWICVLIGL